MKAIVVYDSQYGNTEQIATAIGRALPGEALILPVNELGSGSLSALDFVIVGSPTQGGRPTRAIADFLQRIPDDSLQGVLVAAFDTRFAPKDHGIGLRLLMRIIGFAAPRIAESLRSRGGQLLVPPEGFIVENKEGPLKQGEQERAAAWLTSSISSYLAHRQKSA